MQTAKRLLERERDFYLSPAWTALRLKRLHASGYACEKCGGTPRDGFRLEVHHMLSRKDHPQFELEYWNTQTLCRRCHKGVHLAHLGISNLPAANDPRYEIEAPRPYVAPEQKAFDF